MSKPSLEELREEKSLLAQKLLLLREINDIEKQREDRKRKKEKRKESGERGRTMERIGSKRKLSPTKPSQPRKKSRKIYLQSETEVTVLNPISKKKITIGGGRSRQNKAFKSIIKGAAKENFEKTGKNTNALVNILAQAQEQGITWWDTSVIPFRVQRWASSISGIDISKNSLGDEYTESSESSDEEGRPIPLEGFMGLFKRWSIKMIGDKFIGGMEQDLAKVQKVVTNHIQFLKHTSYKDKPFSFYLTYRFNMSRNELRNKNGELVGSDEDDVVEISSQNGRTPMSVIRNLTNVGDEVGKNFSSLMNEFYSVEKKGSGWAWEGSVALDIYVSRKVDGAALTAKKDNPVILRQVAAEVETPAKGKEKVDYSDEPESGGEYIKTPSWINDPDAKIFNPKPRNGFESVESNMCLNWCILRAKYPNGVGNYTMTNPIYDYSDNNMTKEGFERMGNCGDLYHAIQDGVIKPIELPQGVTYPVPIDVKFFEKLEILNDISLSVFTIGKSEEDPVSPFYASKRKQEGRVHVRTILLQERRIYRQGNSIMGKLMSDSYRYHFILATDFNRLMRRKNDARGSRHWFYCDNCLNRFSKQSSLTDHERYCIFNEPTSYVLPAPDKAAQVFRKYEALQKHPVVIYADFEAHNVDYEESDILEGRGRAISKGVRKHLGEKINEEKKESSTVPISKQEMCGFAYQVVVAEEYQELFSTRNGWRDMPWGEIRSYSGNGAMSMFYEALMKDSAVIQDIVRNTEVQIPPDQSVLGRGQLDSATHCHFCRHAFLAPEVLEGHENKIGLSKTPHYDQFNGRFVGVAHNKCSSVVCIGKRYVIPVSFYNGSGYDFYHLVRGFKEVEGECVIKVIAKSMEKFTSITLNGRIKFIDSMKFMGGGLDTLVRNLYNSLKTDEERREAFYLVTRWKHYNPEDNIALYVKKGVYPYELIRSTEDLYSIQTLPTLEEFRSKLSGKDISLGEYKRAQWAWNRFECKNMADYTDAYCELDVLLLACVMEAFRKGCLSPIAYGLDPMHFITAPSLSLHARLLRDLYVGNAPRCFTDLDVGIKGVDMIRRGLRGGICQVFHPYARGDNYTVDDIEKSENPPEEKKILYVDENNLYGAAMCERLPHSGYAWDFEGDEGPLTPKEREETLEWFAYCNENPKEEDPYNINQKPTNFEEEYEKLRRKMVWRSTDMQEVTREILSLEDDSDTGYIFEVDLDYPHYLHDLHSDFPFCPQTKNPPDPSPFTRYQFNKHGFLNDNVFKSGKLILDFEPKKEYVTHYRYLKLALKHGLVLTKVRRVMSFYQTKWLKPFIDYNTDQRKLAKNEVEKAFFKGMNNFQFGKTIQNEEKQADIELIRGEDWGRAVKLASHPWTEAWRIIDDQLIALKRRRGRRTLKQPTIVGFTVLEISKFIMYQLLYETFAEHFTIQPSANTPLDDFEPIKRYKVLYSDTDSLVLELTGIRGKSLYRDLYELHKKTDIFDFSEIQDPEKNELLNYVFEEGVPPLYNERRKNEKVLWKVKDEMKGINIFEFIALQSKTYSLSLWGEIVMRHHNPKKAAMGKTENKKEVDKKKGLPQRIRLQHEKYKEAFLGAVGQKLTYTQLDHTKDFHMRLVEITKSSVCPLDTKNYWINAVTCYRYGHYKIEEWKRYLTDHSEEEDYLSILSATDDDYKRLLLDEAAKQKEIDAAWVTELEDNIMAQAPIEYNDSDIENLAFFMKEFSCL